MSEEASQIEDILARHLEALERGEKVDRESLLRGHPRLADELARHLDSLERASSALRELREPADEAWSGPLPTIRGYRIFELLGRGGMGAVFLAEQESLKRSVALKILSPYWASDPRALARFRREAETIARISNPGIVPIYEFGADGGNHFLALELVAGVDLASVLARFEGRIPKEGAELLAVVRDLTGRLHDVLQRHGRSSDEANVDEALWARSYPETCALIAKRVAEALAVIHAKGIIHRDVKPSNILLGVDGQPRLIDFGLTLSESAGALTGSADFVGTAFYASPEQIGGTGAKVGPKSDVFSLGAVLYELLSLRRPFDGRRISDVLRRLAEDEPPSLAHIAPATPAKLEQICRTALQKDLGRRYASSAELAEDLGRFLEGRPISARAKESESLWRPAAMACGLIALLWAAADIGRPRKPAPAPAPAPQITVVPAAAPRARAALAVEKKSVSPAAPASKGFALAAERRYGEAAMEFEKSLAAAPADLKLRLAYAEALALDGNSPSATKQYDICEALAPKDPQVLQAYGAFLARGGNAEEAVKKYQKSLDVSSSDAKAHLIVADLLGGLNRDDEAAYYYAKAERLANSDEEREAARQGLARRKHPQR